jgi:hypothetical protein
MPGPLKTKTAESGPTTCKGDTFKTQSQKDSRVVRPRGTTIIKKSET